MLWGVLTQVDKDFNYLTIWIWISKMPPQTNQFVAEIRWNQYGNNFFSRRE